MALRTGSTSERFTLLKALYKCFNTIQYNIGARGQCNNACMYVFIILLFTVNIARALEFSACAYSASAYSNCQLFRSFKVRTEPHVQARCLTRVAIKRQQLSAKGNAKKSHKNDSGLQGFELRGTVDKVWLTTLEKGRSRGDLIEAYIRLLLERNQYSGRGSLS